MHLEEFRGVRVNYSSDSIRMLFPQNEYELKKRFKTSATNKLPTVSGGSHVLCSLMTRGTFRRVEH